MPDFRVCIDDGVLSSTGGQAAPSLKRAAILAVRDALGIAAEGLEEDLRDSTTRCQISDADGHVVQTLVVKVTVQSLAVI